MILFYNVRIDAGSIPEHSLSSRFSVPFYFAGCKCYFSCDAGIHPPCGFSLKMKTKKRMTDPGHALFSRGEDYFFIASSTATATATVAPTIGLLPMPMSPIISTCAGTEEEPANWASECIRPMVSVMP